VIGSTHVLGRAPEYTIGWYVESFCRIIADKLSAAGLQTTEGSIKRYFVMARFASNRSTATPPAQAGSADASLSLRVRTDGL
jgi:hypothetical protein